MDTTKLRLVAGAGAAFFGFAGLSAFSVAAVIALVPLIGLLWASFAVASTLTAIALICVVIFLRPSERTEEEIEDFENATADFLADLPFDTVASLVERRPISAATIALAAGYMIVSHPDKTAKGLQKLIDEMI